MSNRTTPFIKRMRVNGGTLFSFNSSIEDIGLNINEKNNDVKMSHFALLNIPSIEKSNQIGQNWFNVQAIAGAWEYENDSLSIKDGRVLIAESFQNYASNLETILLDQTTYNPELQDTITERVFWKWLKETGAIRWTKDASDNWTEDNHADYNSIVKYIGQISAGNVRRDTFGTYNETYIMMPTSHGQTEAWFKHVTDSNYNHGFAIGELGEKISGRTNWLKPHPDGLSYDAYYDYIDSSTSIGAYTLDVSAYNYTGAGWWYTSQGIEPATGSNYYFTDTSAYLTNSSLYNTDLTYTGASGFEFRRSSVDCMSLVIDLDELKVIYNDSTLSYNKLATTNSINDSFDFNAVLIYYTVYNSTGDTVLARNLLGVMFLDAPSGNTSSIGSGGILLPSIEKIQSQSTGFGTAYSLRLNIKSDNTIDDTQAVVVDYSTSDISYAEDFNDTMAELTKTIQILNQQTATINYIATSYNNLNQNQVAILNNIASQQQTLNAINLTPTSLKAYNTLQDASIAINTANNIIQDASILNINSNNISQDASLVLLNNYNQIQDASIAAFSTNIIISKTTITASDLANIDTSTNGILAIAAPIDSNEKILLSYPIFITYKYNGTSYTSSGGNDFNITFNESSTNKFLINGLVNATNYFTYNYSDSSTLDASGGLYIHTNGTMSGAGGDFIFHIPYMLIDIS